MRSPNETSLSRSCRRVNRGGCSELGIKSPVTARNVGMRCARRGFLLLVASCAALWANSGQVTAAPVASASELDGNAVLATSSLVIPGVQVLDEGQQLRDARLAALSSPEAVAQRATSQGAFHGLGRERAAQIDRGTFPALFDQTAGGTPTLPPGQKLAGYLSDHAARIDLGGAQNGIVESVEPIALETARRHFKPLSLNLTETGSAFQPASSTTDVRIPKHLSDGVQLRLSGITLTPTPGPGAAPRAGEGTRDGAAVFYANTATDTDTVVKPTIRGFATEAALRSAASPITLGFKVGLPARGSLQRALDGSNRVEVVKEHATVATIRAPLARDAAGTAVPVTMSVSGHTLLVTVQSRAGHYQYPILVDPEVESLTEHPNSEAELGAYGEYDWHLTAGGGAFEAGQAWVSHPGRSTEGELGASSYVTNGDSMLYKLTGEVRIPKYLAGEGYEGFVEFHDQNGPQNKEWLYGSETATQLEPFCALPGCAPYGGAGHNSFSVGLLFLSSGFYYAKVSVEHAALYISQPKETHSTVAYNTSATELNHTANVLNNHSAWLSPAQGAFEVTATDKGLGVILTKMEFQQPDGKWKTGFLRDNYHEHTPPSYERPSQKEIEARACFGVQCAESQTEVFTWRYVEQPGGRVHCNCYEQPYLHDGEQKVRYVASDAMAGSASSEHGEGEATFKVDATPPRITLSGLPRAPAEYGPCPNKEGGICLLRDARYELGETTGHLKVEATDGANGVPSSGVRSVQVGIDGKELGWPDAACWPGPCPVNRELTLNGHELGVGAHTLEVNAYDNAGNVEHEKQELDVSAASPMAFGPGSVNPQSGDFATEATDVSLSGGMGGLAVTRHYESLNPSAAAESPLGPQWSLSLGSLASLEVLPDKSVMVVGPNGITHFSIKQGGGFQAPVGDTSLTLEYEATKAEYLLKDPAKGTTTRFTLPPGAKSWMPTVSEGPVVADTMTDEYTTVEIEGKKIVEPTLELAPHPSASCARGKMQPGCRGLEFEYAPETTAAEGSGHGEEPSEWGDYKGHLKQVLAVVYDPSSKEMVKKALAAYEYDKGGRLRAEWDPRVSPKLKTTYTYDSESHLTTIAPPGVQPWLLHYGTIPSDANTGRLLSASRPTGPGTYATSTIVYRVPVSGAGAPKAMGAKEVEVWGQKDYPADATAIFPPDEVPSSPPADYRRAKIYYFDSQARLVNVASPSGAISTSEYNSTNNVVRSLSAAHRAQAAKESKPADAAQLLDTKSVYQNEGTQLKETLGPQHLVKLAKGKEGRPEEALARNHVQYYYNEGAPPGETYDLVTKTTDGALTASKEEFDVRTSKTSYEGPGWYLRKPTSVTKDVGGLNLTSSAVYDENTGNLIESTSAAGTAAKPNTMVPSSFSKLGRTGGKLESPRGVAVNQKTGNVYVTDYPKSGIDVFNSRGEFLERLGGAPGTRPKLPEALAIDPAGNIWVGDSGWGEHNLEAFTEKGAPLVEEEGHPILVYGFSGPIAGIAAGSSYEWASDPSANRVRIYGLNGTQKGKLGKGTGKKYGQFRGPTGVALRGSLVYVADSGNNRVQAFTFQKKPLKSYGPATSLDRPQAVAVDPATGNLYVASYEGYGVNEFTPWGTPILQLASVGSGQGQVKNPSGVAVGAGGRVYVADPGNGRVDVWTPTYVSADTKRTVYYSAEANAEFPNCGNHPEWENLPCQTQPAAQPGTPGLPSLPVTTITYNMWDQAEATTEALPASGSYAATTRTKKTTFDGAGRPRTSEETASPSSGAPLPKVTDTYSSITGALETQSTTAGETTTTVTSTYNSLGQLERYTDADGNTATYAYDIDGRIKEVKDQKGEQKYTYDETTGFPTELVDSAAGKFTAAYDAAGRLLSEVYPNALTATYERNEAGEATSIKYTKTSHCKGTCPETWFKESDVPSIHGETLTRESSLSKEQYSYDGGGRLTEVQETPAEGPEACTTRIYKYDEEANRTSLTTRKPGSGGKCASEGGTSEPHTYDIANRLTDPGISYDAFGNTAHLPASDAGGPEGGSELTSSYYVDNQLYKQTQKGETLEYRLDPEERTRETLSSGSTAATVISHYDGPGGALAWTSESGKWTRNIPGIGGGLTAIQTSSGKTTLQLHDLKGNIVATVGDSEAETKLETTYNSTEFGVPTTSNPPKYSWLGAAGVASELPSGNIAQDGVTYVPLIGRPLQSEGYASPPIPTNAINPYASAVPPWVAGGAAEGAAQQLLAAQKAREAREAEERPAPITYPEVPPLPIPPYGEPAGPECNEQTEGCGPDPEHGNNSLQCKVWASWGHPAPGAGELGVYAHWSCKYAPDGFEAQYALQYVDWGGVTGGEYEMVPPPGTKVWHYVNHGEAHRFWSCEGEKWYRAWVWGRYWFPGGKTVWSASAIDGHLEKCGERPPPLPGIG
jgi:YD repeat-containing protein